MSTETFSPQALADKVIVVTGAAGGIGASIVRTIRDAGATVIAVDRNMQALDTVVRSIKLENEQALQCDLCDLQQVEALSDSLHQKYGMISGVVNNAAILPENDSLLSCTDTQWNAVMQVNLQSVLWCSRYLTKGVRTSGCSGSIVNIASIAAHLPNNSVAYGASKAAVLALTRQMAVEWGECGLRANAVSPGMIMTPMSAQFYEDKALHARRRSMIPSGRIGQPEDIANAVAFLLSEASTYMTGQELTVDGGFSLASLYRMQTT
ncbi:SDR family NAD(P)-dependent oxidoreductase [Orrella marina]|uniref:SDR family NAD(P)-dependent oxidoreductase n=1 Tax=Orrella marina TaxID=2163011 RepID=UPI00131EF2F2|nr:SDR family oxidoreductase [Orrella marina]